MLKLASEPVKNGHKVIAYAFYSRLAESSYIFTVIFYQLVSVRCTVFYFLGHRHAFNHLKLKAVLFGIVLYLCNGFS